MKYILLPFSLLIAMAVHAQNVQRFHDRLLLVDTHNDILEQCTGKGFSFDQNLKGKAQSDLARFKQGGVDVQIFSVWCDGTQKNPFAFANRQMDTLDAIVKRNPDKIVKVGNTKELKQAVKKHKLAAMFGVEGGHMMEDNLANLDSMYKRGTRYMTLTWNNSTNWASSAFDETASLRLSQKEENKKVAKGLSGFGKEVVKHMNELGMMVDLSHVGEQTFWDVINTTSKPVLVSHSSVYALCPAFRNLKDDQIKAVAKNGGVIDVNFFSGFLDSNYEKRNTAFALKHKAEKDSLMKINPEPYFTDEYLFNRYPEEVKGLRPPLSLLINHIDYIVKLVGVDYVGIGSDFDGINSSPQQLDDVTSYPLITKALLDKGYSKKDIRKIYGENFLRVFKANEK